MKRFAQRFVLNTCVAGMTLAVLSGPAFSAVDVCSQGIGEPPFLALGVKSNLLMLLDNSGSMLDMAYIDSDTDGAGPDTATQCFDESFDPANVYAGNFTEGSWYIWQEPTPVWKHQAYAIGNRVIFQGVTYKAISGGTSNGATLFEDSGVDWEPLLRPDWVSGKYYHRYSFVFTDTGKVYYATADGTSNNADIDADTGVTWAEVLRWEDAAVYPAGSYTRGEDLTLYYTANGGTTNGTRPIDDQGVLWEEADFFGWRAGINYAQGDIVTYRGMIYIKSTVGTHNSSGTDIYDDTVTWNRIDEGYFDETTTAAASSHCSTTPGTKHTGTDACATVNTSAPGSPEFIAAFGASGKFLNWITASKFDIQKNILTGGKYNIEEQRIISENRGCGGNRFIKQFRLDEGTPANLADDMYITMAVRKPAAEDRVDWSDDTGRFEIYAITANGMDFDACQAAIEGFQDPGGLGPAEAAVAACVGFTGAPSGPVDHIVYHKAIQECWFYAKHGRFKGGNDHPFKTCPLVYTNITPSGISPSNPGYVCYGVYDETLAHDARTGFVGRCWEATGVFVPPPGDPCQPKPCSIACASPPCYFDAGGSEHRCLADGFEYNCPGSWVSNKPDECNVGGGNKNGWEAIYWDTSAAGPPYPEGCVPAAPPPPVVADYWSGNLDGDLFTLTAPEPDPDLVGEECVDQAMQDYCLQTEQPEVIDPTDQSTTTSAFWNLPAILVDAGLAGQLGENPLSTMKVHINSTNPIGNGVLKQKATDLRIGAMAFNVNGAGSECGGATVPDQIVQYCPRSNLDGASVITPIRLGSLVTDDMGTAITTDDILHVDDMAASINAVRATSWTPLAEAMYNAIGYYTQNPDMRLNDQDFQTEADVLAGWQNNRGYPSNSYVLEGGTLYTTKKGGRSNGAAIGSDSGINDWTPVGDYRGTFNAGVIYNKGDIVLSNEADTVNHTHKLYITYSNGSSIMKMAAPDISPLYDRGIVWEPLVDPVARFCQSNNVLIITEGASTADVNTDISDFIAGAATTFNSVPIADVDGGVPDDECSETLADGTVITMNGSTYLDDIIYFGRNHLDPTQPTTISPFTLYPSGNEKLPEGDAPFAMKDKKSITTHIVVAGSLRSNGAAGECDPETLMNSSAYNGGGSPTPLIGENPEEVKTNIGKIVDDLSQRASAGSAASVISSARGGEGAIYQAIFWPELVRMDALNRPVSVEWAGDVHGLFLDSRGYMYEDTNGDRTLRPFEDLDGDGWVDENEGVGEDIDSDNIFDNVDEDIDLDGNLDVYEDVDEDGNLDVFEDVNLNSILDPGEDIDGDGTLDNNEDIDGDGTLDLVWNDLNSNGLKDPGEGEDLDGDGKLDTGEDVNHNNVLDAGEDLNNDTVLQRTEDLDGDGNFDAFLDLDGDGNKDVEENLEYPGYSANRATPDGDDLRVIIFYDSNAGRSKGCMNNSITTGGICTDAVEMDEINFLWSANEWLADPALITGTNRATYLSNDRRRYIFTWNDLNNDGMAPWALDPIDNTGEILHLESSINWDTLAVDPSRGTAASDFDLPNDISVDRLIEWVRGNDDLANEDVDNDGVLDAGEDTLFANGLLDVPLRSREIPDVNPADPPVTWRLGDIIHSTPMTVAAPAEGYHLIYNDYSYAQFLSKYSDRRHVIYFGANDGMLHAVNAGYYSSEEKKFCLAELQGNGDCDESVVPPGGFPELGAELWAYLPYNLIPHIKCLADSEYEHKYFVDQRPRIFDVQIFQEEASCRDLSNNPQFDDPGCIHPEGWGTILVGGMRFGGAPIEAYDTTYGLGTDTRKFTSSWFIIDITDPDREPVLLGEMTHKNDGSTVDLGYTTGMPTMGIMKYGVCTNVAFTSKSTCISNGSTWTEESDWYLVFGNGPTDSDGLGDTAALKGISDMNARVSVLPLDWLIPGSPTGQQPLQISPNHPSVTGNNSGTYMLPSPNGFVSDMITVDYDINPSYEAYKSDVIYFGTVEGDFGTNPDGTTYWNGGGKMYRLINKEIDPANNPFGRNWSTFGRGVTENATFPADWTVNKLIDLSASVADTNNFWHPNGSNVRPPQPIVSAPSVGTDGHNFWVYFGTGRFFDPNDKTDEVQQTYYGIKEPALIVKNSITGTEKRYLKWYETAVNPTGSNFTDVLGLTRVDDILVGQSPSIRTAPLTCRSTGGWDCLPVVLQDPTRAFLYDLDWYISGTGNYAGGLQKVNEFGTILNSGGDCWLYNGCTDGWYKDFYDYTNRERNVGQATLLGGLVTYTTYQPFNDVCQAEGNAYLYGVYYKTGTAWHKNVFGKNGVNGVGQVADKLNLGRGLATTPNLHTGGTREGDKKTKAFVQTSTGEILEIEQDNLPLDPFTGPTGWKQCIQ